MDAICACPALSPRLIAPGAVALRRARASRRWRRGRALCGTCRARSASARSTGATDGRAARALRAAGSGDAAGTRATGACHARVRSTGRERAAAARCASRTHGATASWRGAACSCGMRAIGGGARRESDNAGGQSERPRNPHRSSHHLPLARNRYAACYSRVYGSMWGWCMCQGVPMNDRGVIAFRYLFR